MADERNPLDRGLTGREPGLTGIVGLGAEAAHATTDAARTAVENASHMAESHSRMAEEGTGRMSEAFAQGDQHSEQIGEQSVELAHGMTRAGVVVMRGMRDVSNELIEITQDSMQKTVDGVAAMARCRSLPDLMSVQGDLARQNIERMLDTQRRLSEITMRLADEVVGSVGSHEPGPRSI